MNFTKIIAGLALLASMLLQARAAEFEPEVRKVITNQRGYQEAWVKLQNPDHDPESRELPLEVSLPLCNKKSVKKLDEYCVAPDGSVATVSAIKGDQVSYEKVDLSTGHKFSQFAGVMRPTGSSRMPASAPLVEVVCEASCPQMDFKNECHGSGATRDKAFQDLTQVLNDKKEAECKNCNVRAVMCDGSLYQPTPGVRSPASQN